MRKMPFFLLCMARAWRARVGLKGVLDGETIQQPASVSLSSNLLDGFAVETIENLSKISVYSVRTQYTVCTQVHSILYTVCVHFAN
jgi:hypothetical protein